MPHENIHVPFNCIIATFVGMKCYLLVILISMSIMTNDVEHLVLIGHFHRESDEVRHIGILNILSWRNLRNGICKDFLIFL